MVNYDAMIVRFIALSFICLFFFSCKKDTIETAIQETDWYYFNAEVEEVDGRNEFTLIKQLYIRGGMIINSLDSTESKAVVLEKDSIGFPFFDGRSGIKKYRYHLVEWTDKLLLQMVDQNSIMSFWTESPSPALIGYSKPYSSLFDIDDYSTGDRVDIEKMVDVSEIHLNLWNSDDVITYAPLNNPSLILRTMDGVIYAMKKIISDKKEYEKWSKQTAGVLGAKSEFYTSSSDSTLKRESWQKPGVTAAMGNDIFDRVVLNALEGRDTLTDDRLKAYLEYLDELPENHFWLRYYDKGLLGLLENFKTLEE